MTGGEDFNLFSAFREWMEADGERTLLTTAAGRTYSYRDADLESARFANALTDMGVKTGDRVTVQVDKSPAALFLYLACLRAGFVYQPLNTGYTAKELAFFLGDAAPSLVVCASASEPMISSLTGVRVLSLDADGSGTLSDHSGHSPTNFTTARCARNDLAALLYSSGTTGVPKGVMLSHNNLLSNASTLAGAWGFQASDCLLHALPLYHVHGLFVAVGCALLSGARMRWLRGFDAGEVIEQLPECTVMMGVPTYYTRLLAHDGFDAQACVNMRMFVSGSAPLLSETFAEFKQRTGHEILERYGMTETNMNTSNPLDGERIPGTVGPALPGVTVRVMDDEDNEAPTGAIGNLQVSGENVFEGYWNLSEKTAEEFTHDGFFRTGDLASIDEQGYVTITGRLKDLIITGGLNVYPKEVEQVIDEMPAVRESAVIGVPHPDFGEGVVAIVVASSNSGVDEQSLIASLKRQIAAYKCPKKIIFTDSLPRNSMAKVQKSVLREQYARLFETG
jgi:malonyl-CoA/methylmalonyl-CoA synthetase